MKNTAHPFAICAALLFECLWPVALPAADNQGHHQSGIIGRVQVEQVNLPHLWKVRVSTETFKVVADIQTDEDGQFIVNLKPGTYHLTPYLGGGGGAVLVGPPTRVIVVKKDFTVVELPIGSGPV